MPLSYGRTRKRWEASQNCLSTLTAHPFLKTWVQFWVRFRVRFKEISHWLIAEEEITVESIAIIVLIVFAVASGTNSGGEGSDAPDFEFSLFQGVEEVGFREGNLSALHAQPMVLNFWAGLCPPCRAEMPQFRAFYEDFQDEVMLLGVDIGIFTGLGSHDAVDSLLRYLA